MLSLPHEGELAFSYTHFLEKQGLHFIPAGLIRQNGSDDVLVQFVELLHRNETPEKFEGSALPRVRHGFRF